MLGKTLFALITMLASALLWASLGAAQGRQQLLGAARVSLKHSGTAADILHDFCQPYAGATSTIALEILAPASMLTSSRPWYDTAAARATARTSALLPLATWT